MSRKLVLGLALAALLFSSASCFNFSGVQALPWYSHRSVRKSEQGRVEFGYDVNFDGFRQSIAQCVGEKQQCIKGASTRAWHEFKDDINPLMAVSITAAVLTFLTTTLSAVGVGGMILNKGKMSTWVLVVLGAALFLSVSNNIVFGVGVPQSLKSMEQCRKDIEDAAQKDEWTGSDACSALTGSLSSATTDIEWGAGAGYWSSVSATVLLLGTIVASRVFE